MNERNPRNAGRKPKYNGETIIISFRVPKSGVEQTKHAVQSFLEGYLKSKTKAVRRSEIKKNVKRIRTVSNMAGENAKAIFVCGCLVDGDNLFKRAKSCKLSRESHV